MDDQHLTVHVGSFSLQNVSFSLDAGDYGILMGRTGIGKTTETLQEWL